MLRKFETFSFRNEIERFRGLFKDLLDFIKNVYVPAKDFSFPKHKCGSNVRMFRFEWLKDFPWLAYSPSLDGAFCLPCVIFGSKYPEKSKLVKLFKEP